MSTVGFGGTGRIMHDYQRGRSHAYKVPDVHDQSNAVVRKELLNEIRIYRLLASSPHPFILKMLDADPDSCTIELPFIWHSDLSNYLICRQGPPIEVECRLRWCIQLASAVAHLHSLDVYHCDINLTNLLVDDSLNIQLCDFAGSCLGHETPLAFTNAIGRHPAIASDSHDTWTRELLRANDIFAVATTFYCLFTGTTPHAALPKELVHQRYLARDFPATKDIPLGDLIMDCWMDRVSEMEEVLIRAIAAIPIPELE